MKYINLLTLLTFLVGCIKPKYKAISINCLEKEPYIFHEITLRNIDGIDRVYITYKNRCAMYKCELYYFKNQEFLLKNTKINEKYCFHGDLFF